MRPNYEGYSRHELLEALESIDAEQYPERVKFIKQKLAESAKKTTRENQVNDIPLRGEYRNYAFVLPCIIGLIGIIATVSLFSSSQPSLFSFCGPLLLMILVPSVIAALRHHEKHALDYLALSQSGITRGKCDEEFHFAWSEIARIYWVDDRNNCRLQVIKKGGREIKTFNVRQFNVDRDSVRSYALAMSRKHHFAFDE